MNARARILNASAGSGKTYQLAYKYVRDVVEQPRLYRHILAVTFTNKATEEMKSRILKEVHRLASGDGSAYLSALCSELRLDEQTVRERAREVRSRILHDYSHFTVLTIDTFFQRILRAFIRELGIDLNYNVEIETASVLAKSADTLIERITADRELLQWLLEFVQERIDDGKRWDVRDGILALGGELFKEKNRESLALARSKEELGRIVGEALQHARESREELRQAGLEAVAAIEAAGLTIDDFPYKEKGFASYFYAVAAGDAPSYGARVAAARASDDKWGKKIPAEITARLRPLLDRICSIVDDNRRSWNTAELLRENYRSFALLADLYARVQEMCDKQNMMLLSETKYILSEFIGRNDAPFIYEKVGNRYERFMIDEFQDTSVKEWENFLPLLQNAMSQSEATSVLLVGDIKQSIYRWRGGDWKILRSKAQEALGAAHTETVNLRENYRSLPAVVDFNNRMIGCVVQADNLALNTRLDEAVAEGRLAPGVRDELHDMLAHAYHGHEQTSRKRSDRPGYVNITVSDGEPPVVDRIIRLLDLGFRPKEMLILVRSATDGARIAAALLDFKRSNTDPRYRFDVMTQEALIVGKAPVSGFVTAALRLAVDPEDRLRRAVYNRYLGGRAFDTPLPADERAFVGTLRQLSPEEAFERIVLRYDLSRDREQIAYLQALHEQIISFCANRIADIPLFLQWWEETGSGRSLSVEESETTIEITTIHKAKGLEKRVVLIPYCNWQLNPKSGGGISDVIWAEPADEMTAALGRFPVRMRQAMAESAFSTEYYRELVYAHVDNVNLLYVSLTRAVESLHVFVPRQGGKVVTVGGMMLGCIAVEEGRALLNGAQGRHSVTEAGETYEFGELAAPAAAEKREQGVEHLLLDDYPTSEADLRLRLPSQRYFDGAEQVELSPRNFGILMHRAFENASSEEEILEAVTRMRADGTIDGSEERRLRETVAQALADPAVHSWFDGSWTSVRNEHEIVVPGGTAALRRPDRVMIRDGRAVVVDYKFGDREPGKYMKQIREYMTLLCRMGYAPVEGYLWYVRRGDVVKVEAT